MSSIVDTPFSNLPQPASGWQLFSHLASGKLTPGLAWQNPAYRRKFMLRSLATPVSTARLLTSLAKQPSLMQMLQVQQDCRAVCIALADGEYGSPAGP